jgi:hypothetical protein
MLFLLHPSTPELCKLWGPCHRRFLLWLRLLRGRSLRPFGAFHPFKVARVCNDALGGLIFLAPIPTDDSLQIGYRRLIYRLHLFFALSAALHVW